ncbi:putative RNA-directed DNA polymerase [Lupinus albus]|uniref:Putative RNA-directed DNA polymerase n=1 Tax=Lupinus albus TaxID=3870 RepID=A0A6A4PUV9_LUPAL|nr:putative RNA-directed DNA polymerase [Lupinus albus]
MSGIDKSFIPRVPTALLAQSEPTFVKTALSDPLWFQVMQEEYNALIQLGTWFVVDLPPGKQAIGCKWVFRIKENPNGTENRYKVRVVAKGFHQK